MHKRVAGLLAAIGTLAGVCGCQRSPSGPSELSASSGVYYVAAQEPGADNQRCDGQVPADQGSGHCPFRDFTASRTLHLLDNAKGVRVYVRTGTYTLPDGLTINGAGASEADRVLIAAHQGEAVVFDGGNVPRELLLVTGRYVTVQGLTLRNAGGYNLEVRGGQQILITGNRFLANKASDSLKGDSGAADVQVRDNEFAEWDSQAIDMTAVTRWRIEGNRFHDPRGAGANAIGAKFGSRDVAIVGNEFSNTQGLSFGGVSSAHGNTFEAYGIAATRNTFTNVAGYAATFYSCSGCQFDGNQINGAGGGMRLTGIEAFGASGCAGGCQPSRDISASGNQLKNLVGGREGQADLFWAIERTEVGALTASGNTYCETANGAGRFWVAGSFVRFDEWVRAVPSEATSTVTARTDQRCQGW